MPIVNALEVKLNCETSAVSEKAFNHFLCSLCDAVMGPENSTEGVARGFDRVA